MSVDLSPSVPLSRGERGMPVILQLSLALFRGEGFRERGRRIIKCLFNYLFP
jgi:hypothetical protein